MSWMRDDAACCSPTLLIQEPRSPETKQHPWTKMFPSRFRSSQVNPRPAKSPCTMMTLDPLASQVSTFYHGMTAWSPAAEFRGARACLLISLSPHHTRERAVAHFRPPQLPWIKEESPLSLLLMLIDVLCALLIDLTTIHLRVAPSLIYTTTLTPPLVVSFETPPTTSLTPRDSDTRQPAITLRASFLLS